MNNPFMVFLSPPIPLSVRIAVAHTLRAAQCIAMPGNAKDRWSQEKEEALLPETPLIKMGIIAIIPILLDACFGSYMVNNTYRQIIRLAYLKQLLLILAKLFSYFFCHEVFLSRKILYKLR